MWTWLEIVVLNAISATGLAIVAAGITRRVRRPVVVHAVWVLVLVKLVSVPVLEFNMGPLLAPVRDWVLAPERSLFDASDDRRASLTVSTDPQAVNRTPWLDGGDAARQADPALRDASLLERGFDIGSAVRFLIPATAWAGAVGLIVLWIVRACRFRRRLRERSRLAPQLEARLRRVAARLGVSHPPHVRLIHERIPPSLVPAPGRCEILLPQALLPRLTDAELDTLLAHELAHFRRRDHWMRAFELTVGALFWWHPVAWWARRNLRAAEEMCCDALVTRALPHRARAYAESLLKTVEFVSTPSVSIATLATGAGESNRLKERLMMIMNRKGPRPLSARLRVLLLALALTVLVVSPAWMGRGAHLDAAEPVANQFDANLRADQHDASKAVSDKSQERDAAREAVALRMLALEREKLQLEREFAELEFERMRVHERVAAAEARVEEQRLREELQQYELAGDEERAQMLHMRLEIMKREAVIRRQDLEFEQRHMRRRFEVEFELRGLEIELHNAQAQDDTARVEESELRMQQLRGQLREIELEGMRGELSRSRRQLELERSKLDNTGGR